MTTHDTCVSTGDLSEPLTGSALRTAVKRISEMRVRDTHPDPYYTAKEQLYRSLADLRESGELREEILLGVSTEAREVISQDPPPEQLKQAVARLEVVIEIRGTPLTASET